MTYNLVKLAIVAALVVVVIVAMGVGWIDGDLGRFALGLLIGWIVRDVTDDRGGEPIIGTSDNRT